ncbi:PilN domain-containing protein [Candidatus Daviesbacteria bacterium]|nr:PilN domain-containing protein [Candidatus Daviesbacteria bacterium]
MSDSAQSQRLRIKLNLLHPKELQMKLPERFLKWLISYGRFIVIFVEIIVVAAFLSRFKYDADLDELKRKINQDLPYVEGLSTDEALIEQTQNRLALIDKTYLASDLWQETIVNLSSLTPSSIQFRGLTLEEKDEKNIAFRINGSTISNTDLGVFLNNLRTQDYLRDINLTNIGFEDDQILFTVTGTNLSL